MKARLFQTLAALSVLGSGYAAPAQTLQQFTYFNGANMTAHNPAVILAHSGAIESADWASPHFRLRSWRPLIVFSCTSPNLTGDTRINPPLTSFAHPTYPTPQVDHFPGEESRAIAQQLELWLKYFALNHPDREVCLANGFAFYLANLGSFNTEAPSEPLGTALAPADFGYDADRINDGTGNPLDDLLANSGVVSTHGQAALLTFTDKIFEQFFFEEQPALQSRFPQINWDVMYWFDDKEPNTKPFGSGPYVDTVLRPGGGGWRAPWLLDPRSHPTTGVTLPGGVGKWRAIDNDSGGRVDGAGLPVTVNTAARTYDPTNHRYVAWLWDKVYRLLDANLTERYAQARLWFPQIRGGNYNVFSTTNGVAESATWLTHYPRTVTSDLQLIECYPCFSFWFDAVSTVAAQLARYGLTDSGDAQTNLRSIAVARAKARILAAVTQSPTIPIGIYLACDLDLDCSAVGVPVHSLTLANKTEIARYAYQHGCRTFIHWHQIGEPMSAPARAETLTLMRSIEVLDNPGPRPTSCVADFNGDGFLDGIDIDHFNNLFAIGHYDADLNRDGFTDGIDEDLFQNAFEAGCR